MSGAHRMQEFKYCREGATLVISLEGLNWLSKRRCKDKRLKKRDDKLQLLMPSDQELQPITCFCVFNKRRCTGPRIQRKYSDPQSSFLTWPPVSYPPRHDYLPMEPTPRSTCTSLASFVSDCPMEARWTRPIVDMMDIIRLITKGLNIIHQQDAATMFNRFIIFCNEDIPLELYNDICIGGDCRTSLKDTGWHLSDNNASSDFTKSTANQLHNLNANTNNSLGIYKDLQKSSSICDSLGDLLRKDKKSTKRKSVSFEDDVTVYLFDQESPTLELHAGPYVSRPSHNSNLPEATLEDTGLEWDDDFSALENNCHSQLSLQTQSCTAASRLDRFSLSQTCLFLTHVTEADLEL
ncbi:serine/threonine-protein kinase LMTK2-like isoform X1 [Labrus mixtus]|uniref:serine/threonine-protein kinase LMTK2-like isoform X1 n=1 Tax=Labrus mixtus TaxID=508554 RepID=UPI0029C0AEF0|nr:serine/threonine-protein kinase LMTK2-like isoform X1 [Labrus mixtus]